MLLPKVVHVWPLEVESWDLQACLLWGVSRGLSWVGGGSHGGVGGVPQAGVLRLLPGSWQLSGILLRWVLPRSSPDTSHQLFPLPPGLFLGPPGSLAPPVPSPGGGPAGEDSHILTTALRPSKPRNLPGAQQE